MKKALILALALITMAMTLSISAGAAEVTVPDPMAWYQFEDSANLGKDKMGNHDLTYSYGTITQVEGALGQGISMDGDAVIAVAPENDFANSLYDGSFTFSYYAATKARVDEWATPVAVDDLRPMYRVDGGNADNLHLTINGDYWKCIEVLPTNTFDTLNLYTFSLKVENGATEINIYLNDSLVKTYTHDGVFTKNPDTVFSIGAQSNGSGWYNGGGNDFHGTVDEVRVWNTALSAEQVAAVYSADQNPAPETPEETPDPAPETADALSLGIATAAMALICGAVVVNKKRK